MMEKELNALPKDFKDRIIFTSITTSIGTKKEIEEICERNSSSGAEDARRHRSFLGRGFEETWYATLAHKSVG